MPPGFAWQSKAGWFADFDRIAVLEPVIRRGRHSSRLTRHTKFAASEVQEQGARQALYRKLVIVTGRRGMNFQWAASWGFEYLLSQEV